MPRIDPVVFGKKVGDEDKTSYQPVIAPLSARASEWVVAISPCILAIKLQDVESLCLGTLSGGSC